VGQKYSTGCVVSAFIGFSHVGHFADVGEV
jgi:hypothetical protein